MNDSKVILAVDDDQAITKPLGRLIKRLLKKEKLNLEYTCIVDNDPTDALAKLKANDIDLALVIADIMMPGMNGLKFLEEVKQLYPLAPRVVLTGYADKENAIQALNELKLFYYMEKPWDNTWFEKLVINGLGQYRTAKIETMFRKYVPVEIIEEFIDRNDKTILNGQEVEATVLFLDIVDFTKKTETMDASETVKLLNEYFTALVEIIDEQGGILDKFTGDGLMALFGVPHSTNINTDAQHAVLAAVGMLNKVLELNKRRKKNNLMPIRIRVGLDTGKMVAGNIGSVSRVNYTAIGNAVNTAARIEYAAKDYMDGDIGFILISQNTYKRVKDSLKKQAYFEAQGPVPLRGKEKEMSLYRVVPK